MYTPFIPKIFTANKTLKLWTTLNTLLPLKEHHRISSLWTFEFHKSTHEQIYSLLWYPKLKQVLRSLAHSYRRQSISAKLLGEHTVIIAISLETIKQNQILLVLPLCETCVTILKISGSILFSSYHTVQQHINIWHWGLKAMALFNVLNECDSESRLSAVIYRYNLKNWLICAKCT